MKRVFRYILPLIGLLSILLFGVSAMAGISYTDLNHTVIKNGFHSVFSSFLIEQIDPNSVPQGPDGTRTGHILEPGVLMLFGIGLIGLSIVGKLNISK